MPDATVVAEQQHVIDSQAEEIRLLNSALQEADLKISSIKANLVHIKTWSVSGWKRAGDTVPGSYGYIIRVGGYSEPGKPSVGDTYYLAVIYSDDGASGTKLYTGARINGVSNTTWKSYKYGD